MLSCRITSSAEEGAFDYFARYETLKRIGQKDGRAKHHPGRVHQVVAPAVVLQQVTCAQIIFFTLCSIKTVFMIIMHFI